MNKHLWNFVKGLAITLPSLAIYFMMLGNIPELFAISISGAVLLALAKATNTKIYPY